MAADGSWVIRVLRLLDGSEIVSLIFISTEEQNIFPLRHPMTINNLNDYMHDFNDIDDYEDDDDDLDDETDNFNIPNVSSFSYGLNFQLIPYSDFSKSHTIEISSNAIVSVSEPIKQIETMYKQILNTIIEISNENKRVEDLEDSILSVLLDETLDNKYEKEIQKWFQTDSFKGIKLNSKE